jgi:hypothetical protein
MPVLISNNGSILVRIIGYCTECCERFKTDSHQKVECSSYDELCEDLVEREIEEEFILEENISNFFVQEKFEMCDSLVQKEFDHEVIGDIFQNQEVVCYSLQDSKDFGSPIFDEYLNEEEQFPISNFIDLSSSQPVYDNYASVKST